MCIVSTYEFKSLIAENICVIHIDNEAWGEGRSFYFFLLLIFFSRLDAVLTSPEQLLSFVN